ncbi:YaaC family protein [Jeotgalibacillus sp. ET6]|uniref:YaaC family protein n=1 Tax=Jeotgalibacillus sp. ET6 TaxID=3037260 RepID=UPI002418B535|nr:YaaC family protein [Jeotgalibacillus sp. ET6]MDG5473928.1 YaaC family protein [Jeotgalibacillus sp. ET6]
MSTIFNWNRYLPYYSRSEIRLFLSKEYTRLNYPHADKHAQQRHTSFCYHIEHAEAFYIQSNESPTIIQPLLQFYGLSHLVKACLITKDPYYPSNTSQLAHGVSSRKKKKSNYSFLEDTVKIQKNGLFPTLSSLLFHVEHLENLTFSMQDLLLLLENDAQQQPLNPIQCHFLLLYNLSMIARYETEWWGNCTMFKETEDYSIIRSFLHLSSHYAPQAILEFLNESSSKLQ